jgi:hypothetical protein
MDGAIGGLSDRAEVAGEPVERVFHDAREMVWPIIGLYLS